MERLRGEKTIAVNDAAMYAPWATALFSLDRMWMQKRRDAISSFSGEVYLAVADDYLFDEEGVLPNATYLLRQRNVEGLSGDPGVIRMGGGNSGFGALNLAYLKRPDRIVLLGYDYQSAGCHWYKDYEWNPQRNSGSQNPMYRRWAQQFTLCVPQLKAAGIEVLNASKTSAITAFPKVSLEEVLLELDIFRRS